MQAEVADGMSGTKMRQFVKDNDPEGFKKDAVTLKAQPYAEEMFKKLQGIMGVDSVDEKLDPKDLEDDPDYQKELEKEFLKTLQRKNVMVRRCLITLKKKLTQIAPTQNN